jgi:hypothetical protein
MSTKMEKLYYTTEKIDRNHKRYRVCKNKGNDCFKEEFMAKHGSAKFCTEQCNNKFSNQEKKLFNEGNSIPRTSNIDKLRVLMQNKDLVTFTRKEIDDIGIDLSRHDHRYLDDKRRGSFGIWIGNFNITMRENNEIVIRTKIYTSEK